MWRECDYNRYPNMHFTRRTRALTPPPNPLEKNYNSKILTIQGMRDDGRGKKCSPQTETTKLRLRKHRLACPGPWALPSLARHHPTICPSPCPSPSAAHDTQSHARQRGLRRAPYAYARGHKTRNEKGEGTPPKGGRMRPSRHHAARPTHTRQLIVNRRRYPTQRGSAAHWAAAARSMLFHRPSPPHTKPHHTTTLKPALPPAAGAAPRRHETRLVEGHKYLP